MASSQQTSCECTSDTQYEYLSVLIYEARYCIYTYVHTIIMQLMYNDAACE